jgi:hypothetical protein
MVESGVTQRTTKCRLTPTFLDIVYVAALFIIRVAIISSSALGGNLIEIETKR